jgi:hypothetical protein
MENYNKENSNFHSQINQNEINMFLIAWNTAKFKYIITQQYCNIANRSVN